MSLFIITKFLQTSHVFYAFYADVEGAGRGTIAKEDLKVGDIALEIPISLLISEELVKTSDMVCM